MSIRVYRNLGRASVTFVLPARIDFKDHEVIRDVVMELQGAVRSVALDLSALPQIPVWLMGLVLQLEDKLGSTTPIRFTKCAPTIYRMLKLVYMDRFIPHDARSSRHRPHRLKAA
jgi:hypothetical protein